LLSRPWINPDDAWTELAASGTTHVVVHEWAFEGNEGGEVSTWLRRHGARVVAVYQTDTVFALS
jgi:hypothetical protein